MIGGMFRRYDSPDASQHGFKTMGMICWYDSGNDSRQCNMPVVTNSVYTILGNSTHVCKHTAIKGHMYTYRL